jgi:bifunctional DNA-binding transcriptional regulator/antitoxin component of YhaV-PrlF toxin-antitoxin module
MITSITKRGQTVVPAQIRKKYNIHEMTSLQWIDTGEVIKVIPIPKDVVSELRGSAKGEKLHARLMKERAADAGRE